VLKYRAPHGSQPRPCAQYQLKFTNYFLDKFTPTSYARQSVSLPVGGADCVGGREEGAVDRCPSLQAAYAGVAWYRTNSFLCILYLPLSALLTPLLLQLSHLERKNEQAGV
jgi:hypothetical protein